MLTRHVRMFKKKAIVTMIILINHVYSRENVIRNNVLWLQKISQLTINAKVIYQLAL